MEKEQKKKKKRKEKVKKKLNKQMEKKKQYIKQETFFHTLWRQLHSNKLLNVFKFLASFAWSCSNAVPSIYTQLQI